MNETAALHVLLARVGAGMGAAVFSASELSEWPAAAVSALKSSKLLVPATPPQNVVCPGCEQECFMPFHVVRRPNGSTATFVVCDKRSDINRVEVAPEDLGLWQSNGEAMAALLASLLNVRRPMGASTGSGQWAIGVLKGKLRSAHVVLQADGAVHLTLAGHRTLLADVLALETGTLAIDRSVLVHLVDQPRDGGGDSDSAQQRQRRLKKRIAEEKAKGTKAFLKVVAAEEGITVQRLKQIRDRPSPESGSGPRK